MTTWPPQSLPFWASSGESPLESSLASFRGTSQPTCSLGRCVDWSYSSVSFSSFSLFLFVLGWSSSGYWELYDRQACRANFDGHSPPCRARRRGRLAFWGAERCDGIRGRRGGSGPPHGRGHARLHWVNWGWRNVPEIRWRVGLEESDAGVRGKVPSGSVCFFFFFFLFFFFFFFFFFF